MEQQKIYVRPLSTENINLVRWWGCYNHDSNVRGTGPVDFDIAFHLATGSQPSGLPGSSPVVMYDVSATQQHVGQNWWDEAVYRYEVFLPTPFNQQYWSSQSPDPGNLFISICQPSGDHWCWQIVAKADWDIPLGHWTALGDSHHGPWATLDYGGGGSGPWNHLDMAFEIVVPEPATMTMCLIGIVGLLGRRLARAR